MNKADLKKKWSKYCDTDKLVDDMMKLLTKHRHRNSEHGVCVVLDKYFTAKEPLIKLFKTSNHYSGDMRIILKKEFERTIDRNEVYYACNDFASDVGAHKLLYKYEDDDGKTVNDYLKTGKRKVDVLKFVNNKTAESNMKKLRNFELYTCVTKSSYDKHNEFLDWMQYFRNLYSTTIPDNKGQKTKVEINKGMKTSRAFNKVCTYYGIDKSSEYNKLFARYADLVADGVHNWYFVISLNPLDYLTMSIGRSWTSCHSISNHGMYCGGCSSYMMDKTSMITYVVSNVDENLHEEGKIYRQMYHYDDNLFIQSRLYPQGNDGATDLYKKFRDFMCEEFSELLNLNNNEWQNNIGANWCNKYSDNVGHHYKDILHNNSCGIFYPTEKKNTALQSGHHVRVGATSYCYYCGDIQSGHNCLSHTSCTY